MMLHHVKQAAVTLLITSALLAMCSKVAAAQPGNADSKAAGGHAAAVTRTFEAADPNTSMIASGNPWVTIAPPARSSA